MIGLIPKLLEGMIEKMAGEEAIDSIKESAGVPSDRSYAIDQVYSDDEWQKFFLATCEHLQVSTEEAYHAFADYFIEDSIKRFPMWFELSKSAREFFHRQPKIHNGFATALSDPAETKKVNDKFSVEDREGVTVVHYNSPNGLCGLYCALARRLLEHYGEDALVEELHCQKQGDAECEIHIIWDVPAFDKREASHNE